MLQQTTVAAAGPYWERFLSRWPTVQALAKADDADVMREWAGLGYYARARNLLRRPHGCGSWRFPETEATLRQLPGIGAYTAAAIAAIAFGEPAVVDANIERVTSRIFALATPAAGFQAGAGAATLAPHGANASPRRLRTGVDGSRRHHLHPAQPPVPRLPACRHCAGDGAGNPDAYPVKAAQTPAPPETGTGLVDRACRGRRPCSPPAARAARRNARAPRHRLGRRRRPSICPSKPTGTCCPSPSRHGFTHFELRLAVACPRPHRLNEIDGSPISWTRSSDIPTIGFPTLYTRAAQAALHHSPEQADA
jgi:A/G-specific adenine glycosylase